MNAEMHILLAIIAAFAKEPEQVKEHLEIAADTDNTDAMVMLAEYYQLISYDKLPQSFDDYMRRLCSLKDRKYVFYNASHLNANSKKLIERAANLGSSRALAILGTFYELAKEKEKSIELLKEAIIRGSWMAEVNLNAYYGLQVNLFPSDEEYHKTMEELASLALFYQARGQVTITNTLWSEAKDSYDENDEIKRNRFFELYAKLLYGTCKQLSRLAQLVNSCKLYVEEYNDYKKLCDFNQSAEMTSILNLRRRFHIDNKFHGYTIYNPSLFSGLPEPCFNGKPLYPVHFGYFNNINFSDAFYKEIQRFCELYMIDEKVVSNPYEHPRISNMSLRTLFINLDCFEEENPIVGLQGFLPVPIKGASFKSCINLGGYTDYGHARPSTCTMFQLFRTLDINRGVELLSQQNSQYSGFLEGINYAIIAFEAEKEFTVSMVYQNPVGEIENLYKLDY